MEIRLGADRAPGGAILPHGNLAVKDRVAVARIGTDLYRREGPPPSAAVSYCRAPGDVRLEPRELDGQLGARKIAALKGQTRQLVDSIQALARRVAVDDERARSATCCGARRGSARASRPARYRAARRDRRACAPHRQTDRSATRRRAFGRGTGRPPAPSTPVRRHRAEGGPHASGAVVSRSAPMAPSTL